MPHGRRVPFLKLLPLTLIGGAFAPVPAVASSPNEIRALVEQLDAPELADRDAAMQRLIELEAPYDTIRAADVKLENLSAEQRTRLDRVLFEGFKRSPRGGLGVGFDAQFFQGVRLQSVVPEFPASKMLQPMDVIAKVEGLSLSVYQNQQGWQALRHRILSFNPGETMPMVVQRENKTLQLDVPVGRYDDLDRAAPISEEDYVAAWSYRRERMGIELRDASRIGAPRITGAWNPMTPLDEYRMEPELGLIAGGSPNARPILRLEELEKRAMQNVAARSRMVIRNVQPQVRLQAQGEPNPDNNPQLNKESRRQLLLRQIGDWERNITEYRTRAADPALTEQDRSRWAQQVVNAEARLAALAQELTELEKPD